MADQHTPGPWAVHLSEETNQFEIYHDEGRGYGRMLAQVVGERGRFEANARLIASAPELFDACKEAMIYFLMLSDESADDMVCSIQCEQAKVLLFQALRKARGQTKVIAQGGE